MSTSPPSCPELDFLDCHFSPASCSPEPRRARGAPWASRRPRPFVDTFVVSSSSSVNVRKDFADVQDPLPPVLQDEVTNYDCPSPPKRRNIKQVSAAAAQVAVADTTAEQESQLLRTLFPEVSDLPVKDAKLPSQCHSRSSEPPPLARGNHIERGRKADCRSWISIKHPLETSSNTPELPPVLPVTPPRPQTCSTNQVTTANGTTNTAHFRSIKTTYKSARSYTTKNSNRSILRTAAIRTFQQITGVTTASRIEAAAARKQDAESDAENDPQSAGIPDNEQAPELAEDIDVFSGGRSQTGCLPERKDAGFDFLIKSSPHMLPDYSHYEPVHEDPDGYRVVTPTPTPSPITSDAQDKDHNLNSRGHDTPHINNNQEHFHADSDHIADTLAHEPERTEHRLRLPGRPTIEFGATGQATMHDSQWKTERSDKHEQYKQYVYERILPYPHRRDEDAPRKGYKALEMGYLVPPPHRADDASQASHASDEDSIRELKLKKLGRTSQTEFRVLQNVEKKLRGKLPVTEKKTRRKAKPAQNTVDDNDDMDQLISERKKPLSHLNVHTVVNRSVEAPAPHPPEPGRQDIEGPIHNAVLGKARSVKGKKPTKLKKNKKVHLPRGHRPLRLQYSHNTIRPRRDSIDDFGFQRDGGPADQMGHPLSPRPNENSAEVQLLALQALDIEEQAPLENQEPCSSACIPNLNLAVALEPAGVKSDDNISHRNEKLISDDGHNPTHQSHVYQMATEASENSVNLTPSNRPANIASQVPSKHVRTSPPKPSPHRLASPMKQSQLIVAAEEPLDMCDALLPTSSPYDKVHASALFTLRTTNTTRILPGSACDLSSPQHFTLHEGLSRLPSGLWYNTGSRSQEGDATGSLTAPQPTMDDFDDNHHYSRIVLAPESSRKPYSPARQGDCTPRQFGRPDGLSQRDRTAAPSSTPDMPRARRRDLQFQTSSYASQDDDCSKRSDQSTPPCPTRAILAAITPSFQPPLEDHGDDDFPPVPESDLTALQAMYSDKIPAPHQECFTPAPSDEFGTRTQVQVCSVPSDVEDEYHEELRQQRLYQMVPEIPTLAPVPDSPEENTSHIGSTLQTTLNRYGRRVFGFRPLAMRRRPDLTRAIPQDTSLAPANNLPARPPDPIPT